MNYSKGITWFDDCRIPFEDTPNPATNPKYRLEGNYKMPEKGQISEGSITKFRSSSNEIDIKGRFPANLLCSDDMLNDGSISQAQKNPRIQKSSRRYGENNFTNGGLFTPEGQITATYNDKGSNSRYYDIDKWFNKLLDEL